MIKEIIYKKKLYALIIKKGFRKKIARGIFNALVEFKDKYENAIINE